MSESNKISAQSIFFEMIFRAIRWGILLGVVCGIIAGFPIFGIGALVGMFIGPMVGLVSGFGSGFFLSIITTWRFSPLYRENYLHYRVVAYSICILVTIIVTSGFIQAIFHPVSDVSDYLLVFIFIPATIASIRSCHSLVTWYIKSNEIQAVNLS